MAWAPDYITDEELRDYVRTGDYDLTELALYATAASRAVDRHCNRQFGKVDAPVARQYTARYDRDRARWVVDIDDLMTTSGLVVEADDQAVVDYDLEPINAAADGKPWTRLAVREDSAVQPTGADHEMTLTGTWGWTATPDAVKLASKLQGSRFASRRESPHGIAGSPEGELRLLARVDPDVAVALTGLVRPRSAR